MATLAGLAWSAPCALAGVTSTATVQIESISPISGGAVWIEVSQPVSCEAVGGPAGSSAQILLAPDADFRLYESVLTSDQVDKIYALAMSAMMADKPASFVIGPTATSSSVCFVERIKVAR
ncbi:MAG: hypothetical protein AAF642_01410 [Pseudomonadota bacterium]